MAGVIVAVGGGDGQVSALILPNVYFRDGLMPLRVA